VEEVAKMSTDITIREAVKAEFIGDCERLEWMVQL
jgi:hypothetical protein